MSEIKCEGKEKKRVPFTKPRGVQRFLGYHKFFILIFIFSDDLKAAVLSCGTIFYAVQDGSNFWVCGWNP